MTSVTHANSMYRYRHLLYISQGKIEKATTDVLSIMIFNVGF